MDLNSDETFDLQLGPLWVLSAIAGHAKRFDAGTLASFWDTLVAVALETTGPAFDVLASLTRDRAGIVMSFELDGRPVASGLQSILTALDRVGDPLAHDFKLALLRLGIGLGRASSPSPRHLRPQHIQLLMLLSQLLDVPRELHRDARVLEHR